MKITSAIKGKVIVPSKFGGYDHCFNPYVGCQFACKYCYVRFFLKGDGEWGEWVRTRDHAKDRIATDLKKIGPTRLAIGTMTDPYQPIEAKRKITRTCLEILQKCNLKKVGIFTRCPLVRRDIDIIKTLPNARVHFTIPPLPTKFQKIIEPLYVPTEMRFRVVEELKKAGIRVHVSVAPAIPGYSETTIIDEFCKRLSDIGVDEFFVDPMQPYKEAIQEITAHVQNSLFVTDEWDAARTMMTDKTDYATWKKRNLYIWQMLWDKVRHKSPHTMPIMSDHESKQKIDLRTGKLLDWEKYDDYELTNTNGTV